VATAVVADATRTVVETATLLATTVTAASAVASAVANAVVSVVVSVAATVVEVTAAAATTELLAAHLLRGAAATLVSPLAAHPHLLASTMTVVATTRGHRVDVCGVAATGY
jgi:hypothetical protein